MIDVDFHDYVPLFSKETCELILRKDHRVVKILLSTFVYDL